MSKETIKIDNVSQFAKRVTELLKENNYSKTDLAAHIDISKQRLNGYLKSGKIPEIVLNDIANALSCSVEYLTGEINDKRKTVIIEETEEDGTKVKKKKELPYMIFSHVLNQDEVRATNFIRTKNPMLMHKFLSFAEKASLEQLDALNNFIDAFHFDSRNFVVDQYMNSLRYKIIWSAYRSTFEYEYLKRQNAHTECKELKDDVFVHFLQEVKKSIDEFEQDLQKQIVKKA